LGSKHGIRENRCCRLSHRDLQLLCERQEAIEKRLAKRHLKDGGLVLFDLTSSYFEGVTCPLAKIGYSRDGKRGTLQVNYGLLTDARGCPVSVSVFEGNVAGPKTLLAQVEKVKTSFAPTGW
jgi:transposase